MDTTVNRIDQLTSTIDHLTNTLAINERRYQTMQRKLHIAGVIIVVVALLAGFGFNSAIRAQQAATAPGIGQQPYASMLARSNRLNAIAERVLTQIEQQQEQMDAQMKRMAPDGEVEAVEMTAQPDMGAMIMLMLHDMKIALELVPQMASDMRSMSIVAHEMNHKMSVITSNMDSTMGRMGRSMPWIGW